MKNQLFRIVMFLWGGLCLVYTPDWASAEDFVWKTDGGVMYEGGNIGPGENWEGGVNPVENVAMHETVWGTTGDNHYATIRGDKTVYINSGTAHFKPNDALRTLTVSGAKLVLNGGNLQGSVDWQNVCIRDGATLEVHNGSTLSFSGSNRLYIADEGDGTLNLFGGNVTSPEEIYVSITDQWRTTNPGKGTVNLYGGSLTGKRLALGANGRVNFFYTPDGFGKVEVRNNLENNGAFYVGVAGVMASTGEIAQNVLVENVSGGDITRTPDGTIFTTSASGNRLTATWNNDANTLGTVALGTGALSRKVAPAGWVNLDANEGVQSLQLIMNRNMTSTERDAVVAWLNQKPGVTAEAGRNSNNIKVTWSGDKNRFAWDMTAYNAMNETTVSVLGLGNADHETYVWGAQDGVMFNNGNDNSDALWTGGLSPISFVSMHDIKHDNTDGGMHTYATISGNKTVYIPNNTVTFMPNDALRTLTVSGAKLVLNGGNLQGSADWQNVCIRDGATLEVHNGSTLSFGGWNQLYIADEGDATLDMFGGKVVSPRGLYLSVVDEWRKSNPGNSTVNFYAGEIEATLLKQTTNGQINYYIGNDTPGKISVQYIEGNGNIHVDLDHGFGIFKDATFTGDLLTASNGLSAIPANTTHSDVFSLGVEANSLRVTLNPGAGLGTLNLEQGGLIDDVNGFGWIQIDSATPSVGTDTRELAFSLSGLDNYDSFVNWLNGNYSYDVELDEGDKLLLSSFPVDDSIFAWDFTGYDGGDVRLTALLGMNPGPISPSVPEPATWALILLGTVGILGMRKVKK